MIAPAPITQAMVNVEQMIEGGDRFASIDRLTATARADSRLSPPASSPVWIRTAESWRAFNRGDVG